MPSGPTTRIDNTEQEAPRDLRAAVEERLRELEEHDVSLKADPASVPEAEHHRRSRPTAGAPGGIPAAAGRLGRLRRSRPDRWSPGLISLRNQPFDISDEEGTSESGGLARWSPAAPPFEMPPPSTVEPLVHATEVPPSSGAQAETPARSGPADRARPPARKRTQTLGITRAGDRLSAGFAHALRHRVERVAAVSLLLLALVCVVAIVRGGDAAEPEEVARAADQREGGREPDVSALQLAGSASGSERARDAGAEEERAVAGRRAEQAAGASGRGERSARRANRRERTARRPSRRDRAARAPAMRGAGSPAPRTAAPPPASPPPAAPMAPASPPPVQPSPPPAPAAPPAPAPSPPPPSDEFGFER